MGLRRPLPLMAPGAFPSSVSSVLKMSRASWSVSPVLADTVCALVFWRVVRGRVDAAAVLIRRRMVEGRILGFGVGLFLMVICFCLD